MASPRTKGRMINRDISNSSGFAKLSPPAAVLFCMLIPHYNGYGKMNGGPGYIKDEVCPKIDYLNTKNIQKFLKEIHDKTSVKWFRFDGRHWIHSINFLSEHQNINPERLGHDLLPNYSGLTPELLTLEVEGEVEEEVEVEGERNGAPHLTPLASAWNEILGQVLSPILKVSEKRKEKERALLKEFSLDQFRQVFIKISNSDFCLGRCPPRNPGDKPFRASYDWIIENDTNAIKVLEGKYDNRDVPRMAVSAPSYREREIE